MHCCLFIHLYLHSIPSLHSNTYFPLHSVFSPFNPHSQRLCKTSVLLLNLESPTYHLRITHLDRFQTAEDPKNPFWVPLLCGKCNHSTVKLFVYINTVMDLAGANHSKHRLGRVRIFGRVILLNRSSPTL